MLFKGDESSSSLHGCAECGFINEFRDGVARGLRMFHWDPCWRPLRALFADAHHPAVMLLPKERPAAPQPLPPVCSAVGMSSVRVGGGTSTSFNQGTLGCSARRPCLLPGTPKKIS
ncbi:hypothetical protein DQ04_22121000 [Trypanosoma grayi]|uniref:hypothetical protein n=1 Tax=Trypanosoma grayi TaxID=71804 RepID=UPI0004F42B72|nr:hypothetical protein DQ04_22121000 [Trypanosoma grayi]KEG05425.1 hypothetical protein DQ04_22121000 [Trypanosoma grayi]